MEKKVAVFTYGRFQPVHKKHGMLIKQVIDIAKRNDGTPFIFTSHKHNNFEDYENAEKYMKTKAFKEMTGNMFPDNPLAFISTKHNENPLEPEDKKELLHELYDDLFRGISQPCCIVDEEIEGLFSAIGYMKENGFNSFIMVVGDDRRATFEKTFSKSNDEFTIIGLERPEDTYSGTKLRHMAVRNDVDGLREAVGDTDIEDLIKKINKGITVPEEHRKTFATEAFKKHMSKSKSKSKSKTVSDTRRRGRKRARKPRPRSTRRKRKR